MIGKKIALVTGANRGLGLQTARELGRLGFKVLMGVRDIEKGQVAIQQLKSEKLDVELLKLDIGQDQDIQKSLDYLKSSGQIPDVLVNNAGVFLESDNGGVSGFTSVLKADPNTVLKCFEINTLGPLKLCQALAPFMQEKSDARIINISSGMGALTDMDGGYPGYRMSKTALNALTRILASELQGRIKVNSVCPGWVRTDMGGPNATRDVSEGVQTTIWLATTDNSPSGGFFRDKKPIAW